MTDTDKPQRKNWTWPMGRVSEEDWIPSSSIRDTRDLRDPYSVYITWKKQRIQGLA